MKVARNTYIVQTNMPKKNGESLTQKDLIEVGYMAGRFGINLDGKSFEHKIPQVTQNGTTIDINSCTSDLFEQNLNTAGIKFNKIA